MDNPKEQNVIEFIPREDWEEALSSAANEASQLPGLSPSTTRKHQKFTRQEVVQSFADAFDLIGGVPRLAVWANTHPTDFYKLYARLLPTAAQQQLEHSGTITIKHILPRGPLDE